MKIEEFTKTKYTSLDGKTVVAFISPDGKFTLKASKSGLQLDGTFEIEEHQNLEEFAKMVSAAWTERIKLKPKIATTLSGH